jgi:hypothetical protein
LKNSGIRLDIPAFYKVGLMPQARRILLIEIISPHSNQQQIADPKIKVHDQKNSIIDNGN